MDISRGKAVEFTVQHKPAHITCHHTTDDNKIPCCESDLFFRCGCKDLNYSISKG